MRRIGRHRRKKINKIIILSAFCLLFVITAGYAAFSTNIQLHVKGNILEGTRVIQAWDSNSQTDFHSDFYKQNIVSITFLNNNNVPENAVGSWNVSEDKEKGTVKAWVVPSSEDSSKYDLYIGDKGKVIANEDSSWVFYNFQNLKQINFNDNFDMSMTIDMHNIFCDCWNLETLNLNGIDTKKVTRMDALVARCYKLKEINLSNLDTSNVTDMSGMFQDCQSLTNLNLGNFNTSKVTDMEGMFGRCYELDTLDLSNFDTYNVKTMKSMFLGCIKLLKLNIFSFNTSNVTNFESMFNGCKELISINLCSFDTMNAKNMISMFWNTPKLTQIKVGTSWTTINVDTTNMFHNSGVSQVTTGQC